MVACIAIIFFFFNDTATTEIYTLSLHDALPICDHVTDVVPRHDVADRDRATIRVRLGGAAVADGDDTAGQTGVAEDRKSTRLNSSHANISYAVFCLKKKKIHFIYHTYLFFISPA